MKTRLAVALCLGAMAALLFSACGDDDGGSDFVATEADIESLEAFAGCA